MDNKKPNIFIICVDQLAWNAISYYGNEYSNTPNIDRIADGGVGFSKTYTTYPMCQPSRASFWSGLYPHETDVLANGDKWPVNNLSELVPTLGTLFKDDGYKTVHFGKKHDAGALNGFECAPEGQIKVKETSKAWPLNHDTFSDRYTTIKAKDFLINYDSNQQPFIMVADYVNPHNICGFVGEFKYDTEGINPGVELPDLPENFDFDDIENRSKAVQYICCSHNRQAEAVGWDKTKFQYYLSAYYHYLERVDEEIGVLLDELDRREDKNNTLIVFMSDHGDSMAARGRITKQVDFYEEVTRVPFIFKGPKVKSSVNPIGDSPVSLLDIVPTLCSYAGITYPKTLHGKNLLPAITGELELERDYVVSQWHTEWGYTISPGRMIRDSRYKYIIYLEDSEEELYDLNIDPLEKRNVAKYPEYSDALALMKQKFQRYLLETNDPFESLEWKVDPRWRSHEVGYQNHKGLAAMQAYKQENQ